MLTMPVLRGTYKYAASDRRRKRENMSESTKKTKKSVHVRLEPTTIEWLEKQTDEATRTATDVARRIIVKEKQRQARKLPKGS